MKSHEIIRENEDEIDYISTESARENTENKQPPIEVTVRKSARAKRLQVQISAAKGVQVIVPHRLKNADWYVRKLLQEKSEWIRLHIEKLQKAGAFEAPVLPESIALQALSEIYSLRIIRQHLKRPRLRQTNEHMLLIEIPHEYSDAELHQTSFHLLQRWLRKKSELVLVPWLHEVSEEIGLEFSSVSVRLQKSRWGSCSSRKKISLSAALLFVRPAVVRYLFIHELCHTMQMNHSKKFWDLVGQFEPNYRELDKELTRSSKTIPKWVRYEA